MRIALVTVEFRSVNGIAEFVDNLAAEMAAAGHDVHVLWTGYAAPGTQREPRSRVPAHTVRLPSTKRPSLRHPERWFRRPHGYELAEMLRRIRPDVLHSHVSQAEKLPVTVEAAKLAGVPIVHTLHDPFGGDWTFAASIKALAGIDRLCSQSRFVNAGYARFYPPAADARVISGGVDCAAAAASVPYARSRPYLLTSSRLQLTSKAVDVVVETFAQLAPAYPELDLVITGDGPDRERIENIVRELGIAPRVEMAGAVSRATLWSLFKGARFFVMASRRPEGLGMAFLESMAAGRPVVGTRSGGTVEIVRHGENGLLCAENDVREFTEAMRWMLEHPEECDRMGAKGLAAVRALYDWPLVAKSYLEVYDEVVAVRTGASESSTSRP